MKLKSCAAILLALALCAGCGRHPTIQKISGSSVVVAFGDSLTFGTGADSDESYPSILSGLLACPVINAGVPGELTAAGLARLPGVLEKERPQLVVLCHGGNDMLNRLDDPLITDNLNAMISLVRDTGADVILLGVPRPGLRLEVASFYKKTADKHRIPFDPATITRILSTPALKSDYVHPNAAGYRKMAESIAKLIRDCERK